MATTTDLNTLKINYLSQEQYDAAVSGGTINANEIYMTPALDTITDVTVDGESVVSDGVAEIDMPTVPTKVSQLQNDSGFISTETDPTVPSWAKQSSKPSYTASEVGAVPTSRTVNGKALSSNINLSASDVGALPDSTSIPSKVSDLQNDAGYISALPDFQVRSVNFPYSLTALGYTNTNLKTLIDADLPTGYRCLGIVGITTNDVYVFVVSAYYANSNYSLQLTNKHDGDRNNRTAVIYYLCTNN